MERPYDLILLASASRTANPTLNPPSINDPYAEGIVVVTDVTTPGTGSITVYIEGYDPASDKWYTILASSALTTTVTNVLWVYPSITDSANAKAGVTLPRLFRVRVAHNNANAITYSVGASILV